MSSGEDEGEEEEEEEEDGSAGITRQGGLQLLKIRGIFLSFKFVFFTVELLEGLKKYAGLLHWTVNQMQDCQGEKKPKTFQCVVGHHPALNTTETATRIFLCK